MNVLYVIGNGFDIAHGFDTSYKSFYKFLKQNIVKYPEIKDVCDDITNSKVVDWSDFEKGFGEFIKNNRDKYSIEDYKKMIKVALEALMDFLEKVVKNFNIADYDTDNLVDDNVLFPFFNCKDDEKILLKKLFKKENSDVYVLTLNYTPIVEDYFKSQDISNVLNIHGKVDYMPIFGVDDESQLKCENLSLVDVEMLSNLFSKTTLIKKTLKSIYEEYKNWIEISNIIIIYGTSLGVTDNSLWELIGKEITKGKILIYCCYDDYVDSRKTIEHIEFIENKREELCNIFKIDFNTCGDRIYIEDARDFFFTDFELLYY